MVRTKRPQCAPVACRSGASSGTVTVVGRMSTIFISGRSPAEYGQIESIGMNAPNGSTIGRALRMRNRLDSARAVRKALDVSLGTTHYRCIYKYSCVRSGSLSQSPPVEAPTLPCLCAQTRRVNRLFNRIYDNALRPLGINTMQKSLLTNILMLW